MPMTKSFVFYKIKVGCSRRGGPGDGEREGCNWKPETLIGNYQND